MIRVPPDQDFFNEMAINHPDGDFDNTASHTPDGAVAGYINSLDYYGSSTNTDEVVVTVEGHPTITMRNTGFTWQGLGTPIYDTVDIDSNRIITNMGIAVVTSTDTSIDFYVSHARPETPHIRSQRRKISLSTSDTTLKVT